ncbi:hypothetical protein V6N13_134597 [Hibiscus sabdariffa]
MLSDCRSSLSLSEQAMCTYNSLRLGFQQDDASCRSQRRRLACRRFDLERLSLSIVLPILFPTTFLVLAATDANSFKHLIFVMFCASETAEWSYWYTTEPFESARLEILSV